MMDPLDRKHTPPDRTPAGPLGGDRTTLARRSLALVLSLGLFAAVASLATAGTPGATSVSLTAGPPSQRGASTHPLSVASPLILAKRSKHLRHVRRASIGLFTATPSTLPPTGGRVRLLAVVQGASTCRFSSPKSLRGLPSTKDCASGSVSINLKVPANTSSARQTYHFSVTAHGRGGTSTVGPVAVVENTSATSNVTPGPSNTAPGPSNTTPGPSATAPAITTQPTSQGVVAGASVTFTAAASGNPAPSVQWQLSTNGGVGWTDVAGATSPNYSFTTSPGENAYQYRAVFTNIAGPATTNAATLTVSPVNVAPVVTTQPSGQGATPGVNVTFTAAASGNPTPSVQWQFSTNSGASWTDVAGATSPNYSFTTSLSQNGYQYRAVFTNIAGPATTNAATLTVSSPPSITLQPTSQSVASGASVTFSAAASGNPAPSVQWQFSINSGASWTDVAGATSASYSFTTSASQNGYEYRAVFTNIAGPATTNAATLTVAVSNVAPVVTTQPSSAGVIAGGNVVFTAAASGSPTPSVQWQTSTDGGINWGNLAGASSTSYSFTASASENGFQYRAVFTNGSGAATSNAATLAVGSDASSSNWSGYVATGKTFSQVSGHWTVPAVSCQPGATTYSSEWVGIDGDTSSTVEQTGTDADCASGSPSYSAWYEMYGDSSVNNGFSVALANPVSAGDSITASVTLTGSTWVLAIADSTQSWSFSTPIPSPTPAPAQSSAEWIVERPQVNGSTTSLSNFGAASFSGASADGNAHTGPISDFSAFPLQMVNGSTLLALPGPLDPGGASFADTWYAAS